VLANALAGEPVAARVHDEPVKPRCELRVAAELTEAGAELHERFLGGVARLLEVAEYLRGEALHARCMPLDEGVEGQSVAVRRLADEVHVAEPSVGERPAGRFLLLDQTGWRGGWLHGGGSLAFPLAMPDSLASETVEPLLTGRFGRPYLYENACESTQALLGAGLQEGATAVCDVQTAGRGRLGRGWEAPPGTSILCSVLLEPPVGSDLPPLSLVGGLAAAQAVERATGLGAQIKWPNDVMLNRRKVAGVLAEASGRAVVLGIGLNVNQTRAELPVGGNVPAASLRTIDGVVRDRAPLLADLLEALERAYDTWRAGGVDALYDGIGARDFLRGRRVIVDGKTGVGIAVDRSGRLEVELDGKRRLVESGEVRFER
jgi:BirA family biotin operon repressor/biotin-[acetyl-CoA-carboxylase] ligase